MQAIKTTIIGEKEPLFSFVCRDLERNVEATDKKRRGKPGFRFRYRD
jgi:hypothetical protein